MEGTLADLHCIDSPKKTDEQICFIFLPGRVISKKIPTRSFFFWGENLQPANQLTVLSYL